MAWELTKQLVVLCEGAADQAFLRDLARLRGGFPEFDMLPSGNFHGADAFKGMLGALRGAGRGFSSLSGILIIADSTDAPSIVFGNIQKQISQSRGYPVPAALSHIARGNSGEPSVFVTLLPDDDSPGALETLAARYLIQQNPWVQRCLDSYLSCGQIEVNKWPAEKRDKAKFHCLVAALNRDDPSKSMSYAFKSSGPVVDVMSNVFDGVASRLRSALQLLSV